MDSLPRLIVWLWLALFGASAFASGTVSPQALTYNAAYGTSGNASIAAAVASVVTVQDPLIVGTSGCSASGSYSGIRVTFTPSTVPGTATYAYEWKVGADCHASNTATFSSAITSTPGGCPSNSILVGGSCTCNATYVPNAGATACVTGCAATAGQTLAGEISIPMTCGSIPTSTCSGGCTYTNPSSLGTYGSLAGACTYFGNGALWTSAGTTCTPAPVGGPGAPSTPAQPDPVPLAPGMCPGSVNGVTVPGGVPCSGGGTTSGGGAGGGAAPSSPPPAPGTPGAPEPGGAVDLGPVPAPAGTNPGDTGSATSCVGSKCTTTDCMIVIQTGGEWVKECTTTGSDKGTYCDQNKGSPLCTADKSTFGGACDAFVCTGDAVQCTIAKDQMQRNCQMWDKTTTYSAAGVAAGTAGDKPGDHPGAAANIQGSSVNFSTAIDQTNPWSSACLADQVLPINVLGMSQSITIPWGSTLCTPMTWMGRIAVALSLALAARLLVRST